MKPISLEGGDQERDGAADSSRPHMPAHVTLATAAQEAAEDMTTFHAPASADDVPASVRAAVAEFVPPPGFEPFPTPTKNNLQRSLIYFFGRRVQSSVTGKSQWFCLASPQCRANKTTISTTANLSGCTRHLQVFHRLISPKTAQMTRKASSQQPQLQQQKARSYLNPGVPLIESHSDIHPVQEREQPQADTVDVAPEAVTQANGEASDDEQPKQMAGRAHALEWTLAVVVRNLLPVSLASDDRLVQLTRPSTAAATERRVSESTVRHHLVELYDALSSSLAAKIRTELAVATLPILHLALVPVGGASATSACHTQHFLTSGRCGHDDIFVALQATFVSSAFTHEKHVLDVRRVPDAAVNTPIDNDTSSNTEQQSTTAVGTWIDATLKRFEIERKHIHSFITDRTLSTSPLAAAASAFLGRSCEYSCASTCSTSLKDALSSSSESNMRKLVVALHEFIEIACDADFVSCFRGVENHVEDFMSAAVELKSSQVTPRSLFRWRAVTLILERVVQSWDACQEFFHAPNSNEGATLSESSPLPVVVPRLLKEFLSEDVAQSCAILRPLGDFFGGSDVSEDVCAEAIVRMFAIKQTSLNVARPLQVPLPRFDQDRQHQESEEDSNDEYYHEDGSDIDVQMVAVEHSQLTGFARSLREELTRQWDAAIAEKLTSESLSAVTCVFFHPCFRHLSFLDGHSAAAKVRIYDHVKKMARDVLQFKAKLSSSSVTRGNAEYYDADAHSGEDSNPLKKRRLSRQEKLSRQAEELSRLGFLDAFAASNNSSVTALEGDQQRESSEADWSAADLLVSRELERYLNNEAVAFAAVSFDKILSYWQHKAFDYPTLALVAQAVLGHPAVLPEQQQQHQQHRGTKRNESRHNRRSGSCIRCCFGGRSRLPWYKPMRDETQVFEELTLFLHSNEQFLNESPKLLPPPEISAAKATQVVAHLVAERRRQQQQQATPVENASADPSIIEV